MILYIGTVDPKKNSGNLSQSYFSENIKFFAWPPAHKHYSRKSIKQEIITLIKKEKQITSLLIELSLDPLFYEEELMDLSNEFIMLGFFSDDGNTLNYSNEISYYFDHVFTTDYSQKLRYESIGVSSSLCIPGVDPSVFVRKDIHRDIDILIYGSNGKGRIPRIDHVKNELKNLKIVDLSNSKMKVSDSELVNYLNRSKLTINWSGVRLDDVINNFEDPLKKVYKIFKGRILESGLMGCVCLSEFDYSNTKLFSIKFLNDNDLVEKIKQLLANETLLKQYSSEAFNLAHSHLLSIQTPIDISLILRRKKIKLKCSSINRIVSTYTFLNSMYNLRSLKFRLFLKDINSIYWRKIMYRYLIFDKISKLKNK